jgi:hypothetical protein
MQNKEILWFHDGFPRGSSPRTTLPLAPHPFDDKRLAKQGVDSVFQFVRANCIEVDRTRLLFGDGETWEGNIESSDPFNHTTEVLGKVKVVDLQFQATAQIEAVIERGEPDGKKELDEQNETLIVVPQHRLEIATPRRVGRTLNAVGERERRNLLLQVRYERSNWDPCSLAFSIGAGSSGYAIRWFRVMLIRAMIGWMAERDRDGYGLRYLISVRRPAA